MRPLTAAIVGALVGAVAATIVVTLRSPPPAAPDEATARALAALEERVDRVERTAAQRPRATPAAEPPATAAPSPGDDVTDSNDRGHRDVLPLAESNVDLTKVSTADLLLEADERHARDADIAGAAKRYRELLSRGGAPSERRHWYIRLGDCYTRLRHFDEAAQAYRDCVDASTEDHPERVACMIALARREQPTNTVEALRWTDRALELESGRKDVDVHLLAWEIARNMKQVDREIRELEWLNESAPYRLDSWSLRLAELRGDKR